MGSELACSVTYGKQNAAGKALLETSELIFRSAEFRLKIPFSAIQSATAAKGELRLKTADGLAIFELGPAAEKWLQKILHPKSRLEKLGVKPNASVNLLGTFDEDFRNELSGATKNYSRNKITPGAETVFLAVESKKELAAVAKLVKSIQGSMALWVVYPKGQTQITENEVLSAGRKSGLKDVKVVGFSRTRTALKFVLPVSSR